jgi:hypothetical protein
MVYDAVNDELRFYVDGALDGSLSLRDYGSISNSLPTVIGASLAALGVEGTTNQFFDGIIDEVRLSNIDRTADWILTSYTNQVDPASFYSIGTEETQSQCTLDTDCGFCEKCASGMCVFQVNEDLKGDCGVCEKCGWCRCLWV